MRMHSEYLDSFKSLMVDLRELLKRYEREEIRLLLLVIWFIRR
jgi:hypothetical protein